MVREQDPHTSDLSTSHRRVLTYVVKASSVSCHGGARGERAGSVRDQIVDP
jgi:hypothetical protein